MGRHMRPLDEGDGAPPFDLPPLPDQFDDIGAPMYPTDENVIVAAATEWHWSAANQAAKALAGRPHVFLTERMATLVRVEDRPGYFTRIEDMSPPMLIDEFGILETRFLETTKDGKRRVEPPLPLLNTILSRRPESAGFRPLAGLVPGPYMLPDGSLYLDSGYSPETRLWLPSHAAIDLSAHKRARVFARGFDRETAKKGVEFLLSEMQEFCWSSRQDEDYADDLDPACWLSYVFTLLTRPAYAVCPMFLNSARRPRSGKDLLFLLAELLAIGRQSKHIPADQSKEEVTKLIGAALKGGYTPLILGDVALLGHGTLYQLVTEPDTTTIRLLGASEEIAVPPCLILGATANQPNFDKSDLFGRIIALQLDADVPDPENRTFKREQDELIAWFRENRPQLLATAFNILRGFFHARRTDPDSAPRGMPCNAFPAWARVVRDCLLWCGLPDVVLTQKRAREQIRVTGADGIGALIQAYFDLWGFNVQHTSGEIVRVSKAEPTPKGLMLGPMEALGRSEDYLKCCRDDLANALDLLFPGKASSAALSVILDKAVGPHTIQIKGKPTNVRLHRGQHNNQAQWSILAGSKGKKS